VRSTLRAMSSYSTTREAGQVPSMANPLRSCLNSTRRATSLGNRRGVYGLAYSHSVRSISTINLWVVDKRAMSVMSLILPEWC